MKGTLVNPQSVTATFAFSAAEGNVGVLLPSQLIISSRARSKIVVSQVKVAFEGGLRHLNIRHDATRPTNANTADNLVHLHHITLEKSNLDDVSLPTSPTSSRSSQSLVGTTDLVLPPCSTRALSLDHYPRDAGVSAVTSITLCVNQDDFDLELVITEESQMNQKVLWVMGTQGLVPRRLISGRSSAVKILPKLPRMQIRSCGVLSTYFTDEDVVVDLDVTNEEEEDAIVSLDARLLGPARSRPKLIWDSEGEGGTTDNASDDAASSKHLGNLAPMAKQSHTIRIQGAPDAARYVLEVKARYHLLSDPETSISKLLPIDIVVKLPFEAIHGFLPMVHPETWPSYFDTDDLNPSSGIGAEGEKLAKGLIQRWSLTTQLASQAEVPLTINSVEPHLLEIHEDVIFTISQASQDTAKDSRISPNDLRELKFIVDARKTDLDDRRSTFLDLQLQIYWRRDGSKGVPIETHLSVPELVCIFPVRPNIRVKDISWKYKSLPVVT